MIQIVNNSIKERLASLRNFANSCRSIKYDDINQAYEAYYIDVNAPSQDSSNTAPTSELNDQDFHSGVKELFIHNNYQAIETASNLLDWIDRVLKPVALRYSTNYPDYNIAEEAKKQNEHPRLAIALQAALGPTEKILEDAIQIFKSACQATSEAIERININPQLINLTNLIRKKLTEPVLVPKTARTPNESRQFTIQDILKLLNQDTKFLEG